MTLKITKTGASQPEQQVRQQATSLTKAGSAGQAAVSRVSASVVAGDASVNNIRKSTSVREIDRLKNAGEAKDLADDLADLITDGEFETQARGAHSKLDGSAGNTSGFLA